MRYNNDKNFIKASGPNNTKVKIYYNKTLEKFWDIITIKTLLKQADWNLTENAKFWQL